MDLRSNFPAKIRNSSYVPGICPSQGRLGVDVATILKERIRKWQPWPILVWIRRESHPKKARIRMINMCSKRITHENAVARPSDLFFPEAYQASLALKFRRTAPARPGVIAPARGFSAARRLTLASRRTCWRRVRRCSRTHSPKDPIAQTGEMTECGLSAT